MVAYLDAQLTFSCLIIFFLVAHIFVRELGPLRVKHDDVIKWKPFPRYWPFVRGIHRSPVNSPHKGQWRGALMFSLICAWISAWVNNREAGNLRRHRAHYDVNVMWWRFFVSSINIGQQLVMIHYFWTKYRIIWHDQINDTHTAHAIVINHLSLLGRKTMMEEQA